MSSCVRGARAGRGKRETRDANVREKEGQKRERERERKRVTTRLDTNPHRAFCRAVKRANVAEPADLFAAALDAHGYARPLLSCS